MRPNAALGRSAVILEHYNERIIDDVSEMGAVEGVRSAPLAKKGNAEKMEDLVSYVFKLNSSFPNPFRRQANIIYQIPGMKEAVYARLNVYDIKGRLIKTLVNSAKKPGIHMISWDGKDHNGNSAVPGIYFYRLAAGNNMKTRRMIKVE